MKIRPEDENGDVLPVLRAGEMNSGARAAARLAESRLTLYAGDWWENPAWGNEILNMLKESRLTEAGAQALSTYLSEYVRGTAGIRDLTDIRFSADGTRFSWSCTAITEYGPVNIGYEL